jgi:hypothetical protein
MKALKDFNYKQFFFDHGERIGIITAGVLTFLLILPLFWPGSGFLAPSAGANEKELTTATTTVETGLARNQPTKDDLPGETKDKLVAFNFVPMDAATTKSFAIAGLFNPEQHASGGRRLPDLLQPRDAAVALVRFQMPSLIYDPTMEMLETLKGVAAQTGTGSMPMGYTPATSGAMERSMSQMYSKGSQMGMSMRGMGSMMGSGTPGQQMNQTTSNIKKYRLIKDPKDTDPDKDSTKDYETEFVPLDKIKSLTDRKFAEQIYPVRAAEMVAAFPYKAQIHEFKEKLLLASDAAVLVEPSLETDEQKKQLAAFRFLGVKAERRQLDVQGKPVGANDRWAALDLEGPYKPLVVFCGGLDRLQPEDPKLKPVAFPGLVMRKLPTFGARRTPPLDEYPKLEDQVEPLKKTVEALSQAPSQKVARPSFSQAPNGSIFDLNPEAGQQNGPFSMPGYFSPQLGSGSPPGTDTRPGTGPDSPRTTGPSPDGTLPNAAQGAIPEFCLIRLFDFSVEPGKIYQYRVKVRMANPIFGRKDVASQGYSDVTELEAKEWYVIPQTLRVPQDLSFYAVDQKDIDAKAPADTTKDKDKEKDKEKEPKLASWFLPAKEGQTILQIQKWVDALHKGRTDLPVGDWVIAERVLATRGEPIGKQRVEVPYWRTTQDKFTMYSDTTPPTKPEALKKFVFSADVAFTLENAEPILVDFSGGNSNYTRPNQVPVQDKAPEEVLLCTADGQLLAHSSTQDAADADRVKRLEDSRTWIQEVKKMKGGKEGDNLFGPPGGPGPK